MHWILIQYIKKSWRNQDISVDVHGPLLLNCIPEDSGWRFSAICEMETVCKIKAKLANLSEKQDVCVQDPATYSTETMPWLTCNNWLTNSSDTVASMKETVQAEEQEGSCYKQMLISK